MHGNAFNVSDKKVSCEEVNSQVNQNVILLTPSCISEARPFALLHQRSVVVIVKRRRRSS
jgi:hypothetical protein